tara:strand:- start:305 stop:847 length:543 start_codon:yes stop_codon:yes gene_type:complete
MSAALVLDIDGTLDTADRKQVERLVNYTDNHGVQRYINTARSQEYCRDPDPLTTEIAGPKSHGKHHCLIDPDPPTSKVINMDKIRKRERIDDARCLVLIDDRPENIEAVQEAGYSGILVKERRGIRKKTVNKAQRIMRRCLADQKTRGKCNDDSDFIRRLLTRIVIIIGILFLFALLVNT